MNNERQIHWLALFGVDCKVLLSDSSVVIWVKKKKVIRFVQFLSNRATETIYVVAVNGKNGQSSVMDAEKLIWNNRSDMLK